nr:hypothetical protein [Tanacetum cinerariifolium]
MTNSKSFNKSPKKGDLYHALMDSILEDENVMDEGVAGKLKKRKPDDADKDEPKSSGKSAKAEELVVEVIDTKMPHNQGSDLGNTDDQPNIEVALKSDWFKKPERPSTPYPDWNARKYFNFSPP